MTFRFTSRYAFTALIAAFLIHNIEEAAAICRYPVENPFPFIQAATCNQFIPAVSFLSAAGLGAYLFGIRTQKQWLYNFISTGFAAVILVNVFIPHVFVGLYTLHYTPGLISAVMLNLPLSLLVLMKNRPLYTGNKAFFKHIVIFLIIGYLLFAISMVLAKLFV